MPNAKPAPLNYARPALRTRAWLKRGLVLAWLALTAYLLYDKWHLRVRLQLKMLEAQRTAQRFVEPADRVVLEGDPKRVAALSISPGYDQVGWFHLEDGTDLILAVSKAVDFAWLDYRRALDDLVWCTRRDVPPSRLSGDEGDGGGLAFGDSTQNFRVFLHERRAGAGELRLVSVVARLHRDGRVSFDADVVSITGAFGVPEQIEAADDGSDLSGLFDPGLESRGLRLFAPQADPADPSRFTIRYESEIDRGIIEGRLRSDDSVEFDVQSEPVPATRRAPVQRKRVGNYDPGHAEDPEPAAAP